MGEYRIFFKRSVEKDFASIPKKDAKRILERIKSLGGNPRPPGSEKLTGQERYRLRQGKYRIVYSIFDDVVTIWIALIPLRDIKTLKGIFKGIDTNMERDEDRV